MSTALASFLPDLLRVLSLQDYGTRVTVLGVALLGLAGGVVGTFLLLRKRALLGDVLAHSTYPGICLAFMLSFVLVGTGKSLPWLLVGAAMSGMIGLGCVLLIRRFSRVKEDAALGLVLGCFFGAGVVLKDFLQTGQFGDASGIRGFLEGNPASLLARDAWLIAAILLVSAAACALLFKELRLLCFNPEYAATQGWPVLLLDVILMLLVTLVVIAGLQAVGLILVIAMLVIPPAAARFWTGRLGRTVILAGALGALSGWLGALISALAADWPAGASIVLAATGLFGGSMLLGTDRGVVVRLGRRWRLSRQITDDNLLRGLYELGERSGSEQVTRVELLSLRSWSGAQLSRAIDRARRRGWVTPRVDELSLTPAGMAQARRLVRNHRLWEHYMMTHADIAPSHVDRGADLIEHILGAELVAELEQQLALGAKRQMTQ